MQFKNIAPMGLTQTMDVEIWSDIRCPFCYIGKHKFEKALENFEHKDKVNIVRRSFELDAELKTLPNVHTLDHLALIKKMSREEVLRMTDHITKSAEEVGLTFRFEDTVVSNTFHAHRLIQFAQSQGLGHKAEEALFRAHFTDGIDVDDPVELQRIGEEIGLEESDVKNFLTSSDFAERVRQDEEKALSLGIRGVPFFLFDNTYAVSGAQSSDIFLEALNRSYEEFAEKTGSSSADDTACSIDGFCG